MALATAGWYWAGVVTSTTPAPSSTFSISQLIRRRSASPFTSPESWK